MTQPEQTDVGTLAHNAAVAHLEECFNNPSYEHAAAEFCGCLDCIVREVLFAAYPILVSSDAGPSV